MAKGERPRRTALPAISGVVDLVLRMYPKPCGSWLASEDGLTDDLFSRMYPEPLWERACPRRRPDRRPVLADVPETLWELACQR